LSAQDQSRQVVHLHLLESDEHHYFGSLSAMYEQFTPQQLGVAVQTLYNKWKGECFENEKVVLRKGRLITKKNKS